MNAIKVFVETGKKRTFVSAVEWPGWCRSGRDEDGALQTLIDYGPRYAHVLQSSEIIFTAPSEVSELQIIERLDGNTTTDFGAPAVVMDDDKGAFEGKELERSRKILQACWGAFDRIVENARGIELRKGPRGGGRDLTKIKEHVLEADRGYLSRLAWKHKRESGNNIDHEVRRVRQAILVALDAAAGGNLPEKGPRGGVIWPPRYFIRRVAWHVLDHAWEINDRIG